jgi:two-component system response regulator HydG
LRTVQERKVKRIGSTKEIDLDVRIIVATNESLHDSIQKGRFREDLYHRFNEFGIYMPPLRERGNDIRLLSMHFLRSANQELGRNVAEFSDEVMECFMNYRWPGNIRELKNVVRRATLLAEGNEIQMKSLPLEMLAYSRSPMADSLNNTEAAPAAKEPRHDLKNAALGAEYDTILKVLREVNFNKTKAAEILQIDRKTLYNKMKAINIGK